MRAARLGSRDRTRGARRAAPLAGERGGATGWLARCPSDGTGARRSPHSTERDMLTIPQRILLALAALLAVGAGAAPASAATQVGLMDPAYAAADPTAYWQ